jgi:hypothetical protein
LGVKVAGVISPTKLLSRKIRIWESASGAASPFGSLRDKKSDSVGISVGLSKTESLCWELLGASTVTHAAQDEVDLGSSESNHSERTNPLSEQLLDNPMTGDQFNDETVATQPKEVTNPSRAILESSKVMRKPQASKESMV